jgi:anti-anti-sigma factor
MMGGFGVRVEELDGGIRALSISGELDQATVPELESRLDEVITGDGNALLVDLSSCEFIDSSGLASLVAAHERMSANGGRRFALCCPEAQVKRLLELTGLDEAIGLCGSRDEALAHLGPDNS